MAETEEDLYQAATGDGFDPDQTWDDEPEPDVDVDDADDHNDEAPEVEQ